MIIQTQEIKTQPVRGKKETKNNDNNDILT